MADNKNVENWTQKTIIDILSIDYTKNEQLYEKMQPDFTFNAWNALNDFLGNYVTVVQKEKLTLHPKPVGPATITDSGIVHKSNFFAGVQYWRIHQLVTIPQLNINVDFVTLVILDQKGKYLIVSLDMALK